MAESERFIIQGLSGRWALQGEIPVFGAKNAALKAIAASMLFRDEVRITNVPAIEDVARMCALVEGMGVSAQRRKRAVSLYADLGQMRPLFPEEEAKRFRSSVVLLGPVLARLGKAAFPHPGGCLIGARPIDIFLEGFQKMGARITKQEKDRYELVAQDKKLRGARLFFRNQSVTATETFMMAGVLAKGKTILENAALEPEIKALADFLNASGARIAGAGTPTITVTGAGLLRAGKKAFVTIPDRVEAGSFLILGALTAKNLTITNCNPEHIRAVTELLRSFGVSIEEDRDSLRIRSSRFSALSPSVVPRPKSGNEGGFIPHREIKTHEYPGFPTDLQAPMTVFLTQARGRATVFETIFEGRFKYVEELVRMGADIDECDPHRVIVRGPAKLKGKDLQSPDLRAGLAFIIAALVAKGESVIHTVYNIDRGYERIEERLREVGANIKREIF